MTRRKRRSHTGALDRRARVMRLSVSLLPLFLFAACSPNAKEAITVEPTPIASSTPPAPRPLRDPEPWVQRHESAAAMAERTEFVRAHPPSECEAGQVKSC